MKTLKTKKDLLKWFERSRKSDIKRYPKWKDYNDFWLRIDRSALTFEIHKKIKNSKQILEITITKETWKYPLYLEFVNEECIKITGY